MKSFLHGYFVTCLLFTALLFCALFHIASLRAEEKVHDAIVALPESNHGLSLTDAVYFALSHDPKINLQRETVRKLWGSLMNVTGQFDTSIVLNLNGGFIQEELSLSERQAEYKKREFLRVLSEETDKIANGEEPSDDLEIILDDILNDMFDSYNEEDEEKKDELEGIHAKLSESCGEDIQEMTDYYRCLSNRAQNSLETLGSIPKASESISYSLEIGLSKQFRNGIALTPRVILEQENRQYRGKSRSKAKGGTGEIEAWSSTIGIVLTMPMGKGWGIESTGANERAARINYQAGLSQLRHTVATTVCDVILSYWDLVAAQERSRLWENSVQLQTRLIRLSRILIEAGEMPRADLDRIMARAAVVSASLTNAKRIEKEFRLQLAEVIGLDVDNISRAPQASDPFSKPADLSTLRSIEPFRLVEQAVEGRQDYLATLELQDSAKVLMNAAHLDLKCRKDLELSIDYRGRDWDASVGNGVGGALYEDLTGPSIMLTFTMDWPFNNNTAKGKLAQSRALWRKSIITAHELRRNIASNVVELQRTLQKTTDRVHLSADSVEYYRKTIKAALEMFRSGEITLIDTILTEESSTDALLTLVNAKQDYAKTVARLRFETGTLLSYSDEGLRVDKDTLFTIPSI